MTKGLRQKAYEYIKEKILTCEYMPNSFINEAMLQEEISASRTPIREALGQLEQENLLVIMPKKGVRVTELSINDINVIYETRMLIEPFIIRTYHANLDFAALLAHRKVFADDTTGAGKNIYKADDAFHYTIWKTCTNYVLLNALEHTHVQNQRVRVLSGDIELRLAQSNDEHMLIIDQLIKQNFDSAAEAMMKHLEQSKVAAFDRLISNGGWKLQA